jgi:hypothetical protein
MAICLLRLSLLSLDSSGLSRLPRKTAMPNLVLSVMVLWCIYIDQWLKEPFVILAKA